MTALCQTWWCTHRQKQVDLNEYKASLVCIVCSRTARTTYKSCLNKHSNNSKTKLTKKTIYLYPFSPSEGDKCQDRQRHQFRLVFSLLVCPKAWPALLAKTAHILVQYCSVSCMVLGQHGSEVIAIGQLTGCFSSYAYCHS